MSTTPMQVYDAHVAALVARDLDAVVAGYATDAVLVDTDRIGQGHEHVRAVFAETMDAAMDLEPRTTVLTRGDVVFVSWRATRPGRPDLAGGDTIVVEDGLITVHTAFITEAAG